jgi:ribosomal protein S12 methylthiotransferase
MKKTVDFITLGCSKNLVDTENLMTKFLQSGFLVTHDAEKPKGRIVVINTCGFIGDAKEESIEVILQQAMRKQQGKIDKLFVMGCLSERYRKELAEEIPEVDAFFGKFDFDGILNQMEFDVLTPPMLCGARHITTPSHYAYIKVAEGCNRACSYCAIPLITGKYKSRTIEDIEQEVKALVAQGVHEFQLIAQDLTYYGKDLYQKFALADLLTCLSDIPGVKWLRLHYAYPTQFPYDILPLIRERDNICKYLDIALQHSSDAMLQKMHRGITCAETEALLARIRQEVPGICLRTTLMVGHPGETEADFDDLMAFVARQKFERMGAFAYSDEENTYSNLHYTDDVPDEVKQQRLDALMRLQQRISYNHNQELVGTEQLVVVDRIEGDYYVARTQYDSPEVDTECLIPCADASMQIGEFYKVRIVKAEEFDFYAERV